MKKKSFILFLSLTVLALGLIIMPAVAAEKADTQSVTKEKSCYRLIPQEVYSGPPGKPPSPDNKHPVCKVLLENLNEFCNEDPPNMVCEFKIHPRYRNQLSVPKWKKLNIYKNLDRIEAMIRTPLEIQAVTAKNKSFQDKVWQEYYADLKKGLENGTATLHEANIDLCNLGKAYEVLRAEHGKCTGKRIILDPNDDPRVAAFEYQQSWVDVDYDASALRQLIDPSMFKMGTMKDVFFFQGETFSYKWYRNQLWILKPFKDREANGNFNTKEICWFEYIRN
jgi:hypothetical protein